MRRSGGRRGGRGGRGNYQEANTGRGSILSRLTPNNRNHHIDTNARNQRQRFRGVYGSKSVSSSIVTLPTEKRIKDLKQKFIKSYYKIFDQPNRLDLLALYSEDAIFSVSSTHPMPVIHFGRNLLVVRDHEPRLTMMFIGRSRVAEVLTALLPTEHFVDEFIVDIPYYAASPMSVSCLQLVVTGAFKDTSPPEPGVVTNPLRAFTRTFVLKHTSTDTDGEPVYQIYNDMFMIQEPTQMQVKKYLALKHEQPSLSSGGTSASGGGGGGSFKNKEEKTVFIMTRTKMNRPASVKLLEENQWNETKAMETFSQLERSNALPRELFQ